ncbi:MAG: NAD(P)/FAD-dependent oxidoreductase [Bacteroidales bacterium]|nr:NAD(P)/FAD-dependent oxidoreductase [Bacteroidales bacterium]
MKIAIIGAGISGLSAGCYLQMHGFDTEIYEKHSRAGGLCTTWKKGDYSFDGCIHWLLGSGERNPLYSLWSELIEMDSVKFVHHDTRFHIELKDNTDKYGSKVFHLYNNIDRLEKYLLDLAPEDRVPIRKFIRMMRRIQGWEVPPEIKTPPSLFTFRQKIGMARHLPLLLFMLKNRNLTNYSFAGRLKNPFLKEAFQFLFDGEEVSLLVIAFPLAFSDLKATGYPIGGSAKFAERISERYISLGGKINYLSGVKEITVKDDAATGLLLEDGREIRSDLVVSAADWRFTVFEALKGRYVNQKLLDLRDGKKFRVYYSVINVSLGIGRPMGDVPQLTRFPLEKPLISPDGTVFERLELHTYHYDPTLAPAGKTSASASFYTSNGEFWIDLYREDRERYDQVRKAFAAEVIDILDKKFGRIKEYLEVTDVATPATYHLFTGNWRGSVQGWLPGKNIMAPSPVTMKLPGLKNFYYASHWSVPGGGLPTALKSARDMAFTIAAEYRKKR